MIHKTNLFYCSDFAGINKLLWLVCSYLFIYLLASPVLTLEHKINLCGCSQQRLANYCGPNKT